MPDDRFIGAWAFERAESVDGDGEVTGALFEGWSGQIVYTAEGRMGVHLMAPDRPSLPGGARAAEATDAQKAAALDSFVAYWGSYWVDDSEGIVTHHLFGMSRGVEPGTDFPRYFRIETDELRLSPPPADDGSRSYIYWRRVRA